MKNSRNVFLASVVGVLAFGSALLAVGIGHPNLKKAHENVEAARKELAIAKNGKEEFGGHREKAEEALKAALAEIEEAGKFAAEHPAGKK